MSEYSCAVIINQQRLLLGKRAHFRKIYPNHWDVIGGKIEDGETQEEALKRELGEEIGIKPTRFEYLDELVDDQLDPVNPPTYHFYLVTEWDGGSPFINNHEHTELEWFSIEEAHQLEGLVSQSYIPIFRKALAASL